MLGGPVLDSCSGGTVCRYLLSIVLLALRFTLPVLIRKTGHVPGLLSSIGAA
ncbi:hypothetical protein HNO89_000209 [Sporosarcina luteola]|nr:hypothetical protein [Sporosarcina luteola]